MSGKDTVDLKQIRLEKLEQLKQGRLAIAAKIEVVMAKHTKLDDELEAFKTQHTKEFNLLQVEHKELIAELKVANTEILKLNKHISLNKWIPVTEKLPTEDGYHTVKFKNKETGTSYFFIDTNGEWWSSGRDNYDRLYTTRVTHWLPEI